jgi:predicted component of type VI protein secretion system
MAPWGHTHVNVESSILGIGELLLKRIRDMHPDINVVSVAGVVPGASQPLKAYFFHVRQREGGALGSVPKTIHGMIA